MFTKDQSSNNEKTVSFHTLGCRLNFSESGSIASEFEKRGYKVVDFGESSDVTFINTCTVTDSADSTCRNQIRKAHKASPEGKIVVAGCYAQMSPEKIAGMQGVDLVLGTQEKFKVFDYLDEDLENIIRVDKSNEFWGASTTLSDSHTRAFLKIQDGCNYICSFCIIPFARGRSRTITVENAVTQAKELVASGYKEIVLTGVNIGEYEHTSGEKLSDLVRLILEIEGLERLRLSSVEPNTFNDELIAVLKSSPKFLPHFHIPLQSGDDEILKAMRRKYDSAFYRDLILKIHSNFPNAAFGADMITGFPGESEEQFENTYNLAKDLPLTHFHVFPFSKRTGTTAAKLPDHIPFETKKARVKKLIALGEQKLQALADAQVGSSAQVLFEKRNKEGLYEGYSGQFLRVKVESSAELANRVLPVKILSAKEGELYGEILQ
jgi:threonylcarbamoyladenosine tRNA methylthiotransferase MtaB